MNHFEQLAAEWLQYNGYFVHTGCLVGPRPQGGFSGELDVVGFHIPNQHLIHIECSLDAQSWEAREAKFRAKFERGAQHIQSIYADMTLPSALDQVALLQFAASSERKLGGGRIITGAELVGEIMDGMASTSPASGATPARFPLLRTLQLAAACKHAAPASTRLVRRNGALG